MKYEVTTLQALQRTTDHPTPCFHYSPNFNCLFNMMYILHPASSEVYVSIAKGKTTRHIGIGIEKFNTSVKPYVIILEGSPETHVDFPL